LQLSSRKIRRTHPENGNNIIYKKKQPSLYDVENKKTTKNTNKVCAVELTPPP
jgi:hypothetical protein